MAKREPWNPLLKSYPESEKINACSMEAETMYTRLIAKSDDNGNFYGDPALITSYLYGHRLANGSISVTKAKRMRDELVTNSLLITYVCNGREYIHVIGCKKALRKDVKLDVRFPELTEADEPQGVPETETNPARIRNESETLTQPNPTNTQPNPTDKIKAKRFVPPTAEEVEAYGREIGFDIDGEHFIDYYEDRDWKHKGGVKMKDWRRSVRTWKKTGYSQPVKKRTAQCWEDVGNV